MLSDWAANARSIDPKTVNWKAIASGKKQPTILVRQLPGPWNSMGDMKFEMPNDYGIYLHDTPLKEKFARRPLDQQRLRPAGGLSPLRRLGVRRAMPQPTSQPEQSSTCRGRSRST